MLAYPKIRILHIGAVTTGPSTGVEIFVPGRQDCSQSKIPFTGAPISFVGAAPLSSLRSSILATEHGQAGLPVLHLHLRLPRVIVENDMVPLDTTPEAAAVQKEAYRRMGPAGRLRVALELSDLAHAFAVAGIRRRHPELSEEDARRELARRLYGPGQSGR